MTPQDTIRAALEMMLGYGTNREQLIAADAALAALAELERASKEPVAWRLPTTPKQQYYDVGPWEYRSNPPGRRDAQPLYAAQPPAPGSFTADEMEEAFHEGVNMTRNLAHWSARDMFKDSEASVLIQRRAVMGGKS